VPRVFTAGLLIGLEFGQVVVETIEALSPNQAPKCLGNRMKRGVLEERSRPGLDPRMRGVCDVFMKTLHQT
jgi:hypothetical protein